MTFRVRKNVFQLLEYIWNSCDNGTFLTYLPSGLGRRLYFRFWGHHGLCCRGPALHLDRVGPQTAPRGVSVVSLWWHFIQRHWNWHFLWFSCIFLNHLNMWKLILSLWPYKNRRWAGFGPWATVCWPYKMIFLIKMFLRSHGWPSIILE